MKSKTPDQRHRSKNWIQIEMYNVMNKQMNTNLFQENKYKTMIPLSDS